MSELNIQHSKTTFMYILIFREKYKNILKIRVTFRSLSSEHNVIFNVFSTFEQKTRVKTAFQLPSIYLFSYFSPRSSPFLVSDGQSHDFPENMKNNDHACTRQYPTMSGYYLRDNSEIPTYYKMVDCSKQRNNDPVLILLLLPFFLLLVFLVRKVNTGC